jgi:hypothetical protein
VTAQSYSPGFPLAGFSNAIQFTSNLADFMQVMHFCREPVPALPGDVARLDELKDEYGGHKKARQVSRPGFLTD